MRSSKSDKRRNKGKSQSGMTGGGFNSLSESLDTKRRHQHDGSSARWLKGPLSEGPSRTKPIIYWNVRGLWKTKKRKARFCCRGQDGGDTATKRSALWKIDTSPKSRNMQGSLRNFFMSCRDWEVYFFEKHPSSNLNSSKT